VLREAQVHPASLQHKLSRNCTWDAVVTMFHQWSTTVQAGSVQKSTPRQKKKNVAINLTDQYKSARQWIATSSKCHAS